VIARARVTAAVDGVGRSRLVELRSAAPLVLRETTDGVYLVGGAAGPLGGDCVRLEVTVGDGASLVVRSSAASLALMGATREPSRFDIDVDVGRGASLTWLPEPTIVARGSRHHVSARVRCAAEARLVWRDELVLGRHAETAGSCRSRIAVDLEGRPLFRHELRVGEGEPGWDGPAVAGTATAAGSMVVIDPSWRDPDRRPAPSVTRDGDATVATLPLEGPALHVLALAPDARRLRVLLDQSAPSTSVRDAFAAPSRARRASA
jgi:urease accessory protein